jgi:hypothetical protein
VTYSSTNCTAQHLEAGTGSQHHLSAIQTTTREDIVVAQLSTGL